MFISLSLLTVYILALTFVLVLNIRELKKNKWLLFCNVLAILLIVILMYAVILEGVKV